MSQRKIRILDSASRKSRKQLTKERQVAAKQVEEAMHAATQTIDRLNKETHELRICLIHERANLLYLSEYIDNYRRGDRLALRSWEGFTDEEKLPYMKQAILQLGNASEEQPLVTLQ